MTWADRTPREKWQARKEEADYNRTNDNHTYEVITGKGTRVTVKGINSAKAVAGKDGTFKKK